MKNKQFSNFHFVKISKKEFADYKGSNVYHQKEDNFKAEPLIGQLDLDIDESQNKINIDSFGAQDFACPSMSEQLYDDLEVMDLEETHLERQRKIDLYREDKLTKFQRNEIKSLDRNQFSEKVNHLFVNLEEALQALAEQQALSDTSMSISRVFADQIEVKVSKSNTNYFNGLFNETVSEVANMTIYSDNEA